MRHAALSGYWALIQVSLGYSHLRDRFLTCYAPVRHSPIGTEVPGSFDLHVLSTPPAFVLSQDQTLRQDLATKTEGPHDTIEEPLLRFNRVEKYPSHSSWLELLQRHRLANHPTTLRLNGCVMTMSGLTRLNGCVMTTNGLTRLCGSIGGYVSNSQSPALAFIVLCSVVKERCDHLKRQHTDTRLPVKAMRRCRSQSALRKQRLRAKGHPTGVKGAATTFQPLLIGKY